MQYAAAYKYQCVVVQSQIIICCVSHKIHQQHTNNTQSNPSFNGGWWFRQWCFCNFVDLIQKHIVTALLDIKVKLCDVFSSWMKGPFWVLSPSSWHHSLSETNWTLAKKIMDPQSNRLARKLQSARRTRNRNPNHLTQLKHHRQPRVCRVNRFVRNRSSTLVAIKAWKRHCRRVGERENVNDNVFVIQKSQRSLLLQLKDKRKTALMPSQEDRLQHDDINTRYASNQSAVAMGSWN